MSVAPAAPASRREIAGVAALALIPLLPFLSRAVAIDAPVFFGVARQIVAYPADPFGFQMVWDPTSPEVAVFNRNPPLLSYYLALWIGAFGESETLLHAVMLVFPLLAALSFFGIARRLGPDAPAATALLVTAPAFLVLATSFLLDVPVLAWFLFAVYALLRGVEDESPGWQLTAGLAAAAAGLTKYVGFTVWPLLAAGVVLLYRRRLGAAARALGVPLAVWALWGVYTAHLYGTPHFWASSDLLAQKSFQPDEIWNQVLSTPVYYGGALVFPVFVAVRAVLRGVRGAELAVLGMLIGIAAMRWVLPDGEPSRRIPPEVDHMVLGALGFAGATLLWAFCLRPRRFLAGPFDRFLMLWLGGVLVYTMVINWHVNAADALLAGPPVLLLLFRTPELRPPRRTAAAWVAATLPLSLLLGVADARQANFYRSVARLVAREIGEQPGQRYFVGHWGLQHYLEAEGFQAVLPPMYGRSELEMGDWVVSARNVSQIDVSHSMEDYALREVWTWGLDSWLPLRTTNADAGAGFYSHHSGYAPFALSHRPVERVGLGRVVGVRPPARR